MASVELAAHQRIDLHAFTREISKDLPYAIRLSILKELFRLACSDQDLDEKELEAIRAISGLFHIAHRDFIELKITIKKEFGLETFEN